MPEKCLSAKSASMHFQISAAAVSGNAGVRVGVRRRGHDPIVGGKSGAKPGNKRNALSSAHVWATLLPSHPQDAHTHSLNSAA